MTGHRIRPARQSLREATARRRLAGILDPGTFREILGPAERVTSPHLAALDLPVSFDDGVVVGSGLLGGQAVLAASQEGNFMGGGVGEVHGAKLSGLLRLAERERPAGVILLLDSGGVRLQEANAGLVAVSEVMRAILSARSAGVPVIALIGGGWGCFGGMSIAARLCDGIAMSEEGRLGVTGPDVIEATRGVEELDASDRAMVWRIYGGKHRYLLGEVERLVADDFGAFRTAARELLAERRASGLEELEREHRRLAQRLADFRNASDPKDVWRAAGIPNPDALPILEPEEFIRAVAPARRGDR